MSFHAPSLAEVESGNHHSPIKRLTDLLFRDLLRRNGTKIRLTLSEWVSPEQTEHHTTTSLEHIESLPDIDDLFEGNPHHLQFSVSYLLGDDWYLMMCPPFELFLPMMHQLKLMANIPIEVEEPIKGKIFFREGAYFTFLEDFQTMGFSATEELFLINFQTPLEQEDKPVVVELTWVPSKQEQASEAKT
ncbi:MAG: hypothetical protein NTX72_02905 [Candidatus Uhrbacteria bacterium]|nr:hypothetical protein [Candidatus Uhrbacteria bacterium]